VGAKLLIGSGGGQVFVSDGDHEPRQHWRLDAGEVSSLAVSPDGAWALCGTVTGAVRLIEIGAAAPPLPLSSHEDEVLSTAFSRDGRWLASASRDRTVRLWRRDGDQAHTLVRFRFDGPVAQVQFHPERAALGVRIQDETAVRVVSLEELNASLAPNSSSPGRIESSVN
jgi:WD40 repeat protein